MLKPTCITTSSTTGLQACDREEISTNLRRLLADVFALYVKTKNFHWHMSGPALSRLSFAARRTVHANFRDDG
jgi:hypothetical protein